MNEKDRNVLRERTAIDRVVNGPQDKHRAAQIDFRHMVVYLRSGTRALRIVAEGEKNEILLKHTIDIARMDSPVYAHRTGQFAALVKEIVSINRTSSHLMVENVFNSGLERHLKNNGWKLTFAAGDDVCRSYYISVADAKQRYCISQPVHTPRSPLTIDMADDDMPSLREVLNRAMNTWEPHNWPQWLVDLDREVDAVLNKNKGEADSANHEAMGETTEKA